MSPRAAAYFNGVRDIAGTGPPERCGCRAPVRRADGLRGKLKSLGRSQVFVRVEGSRSDARNSGPPSLVGVALRGGQVALRHRREATAAPAR